MLSEWAFATFSHQTDTMAQVHTHCPSEARSVGIAHAEGPFDAGYIYTYFIFRWKLHWPVQRAQHLLHKDTISPEIRSSEATHDNRWHGRLEIMRLPGMFAH
jgi:hypothetical protein